MQKPILKALLIIPVDVFYLKYTSRYLSGTKNDSNGPIELSCSIFDRKKWHQVDDPRSGKDSRYSTPPDRNIKYNAFR